MIQEIREIIVPPCGHIDCHGFMGCVTAVRARMGIADPNIRFGVPGQIIKQKKIANIGFNHLDWEIVEQNTLTEPELLLRRCLDLLEEGEKDTTYDAYGAHHFLKLNDRGKVYALINDLAAFLEPEEYKVD